jgi:DNA primase
MRKLQNSTGFSGFGETSWEAGDITDTFARNKELVAKANTVPISKIFRFYNLRLDEQNKKIICPFKSHSGGKETTPSFTFFSHTNTYWCYGCKQGYTPTDFVVNMDKITLAKAAYKIINLYGADAPADIDDHESYSEKMCLYMDFSNHVYEFIQRNLKGEDAMKFIEEISWIFDKENANRDLSNDALESIIFKLKDQIDRYTCPQL